jgi:hypothetical protein
MRKGEKEEGRGERERAAAVGRKRGRERRSPVGFSIFQILLPFPRFVRHLFK